MILLEQIKQMLNEQPKKFLNDVNLEFNQASFTYTGSSKTTTNGFHLLEAMSTLLHAEIYHFLEDEDVWITVYSFDQFNETSYLVCVSKEDDYHKSYSVVNIETFN